MNRKKIAAILHDLMREATLNELDLLDESLRVETLKESLTNELTDASRESGSAVPLIKELRKEYPAEDFWNEIQKRVDALLRPYQETAFLRKMEDTALKRYLLETFEGMIRYQEPWSYLSEHLGVDEEQLKVTYRVQNTLTQWVIEARYSKRHFQHEIKKFFQWSDALSEDLWNLMNDNRTMLTERALLKMGQEIEQSLNKTSSFLDGFDDDFDFELDDDDFDDDDDDSDDDV